MVFVLEALLIALIMLGSTTIAWGVQRFHLPARITTIAFAVTAASWMAFLITAIGVTVGFLVAPSA